VEWFSECKVQLAIYQTNFLFTDKLILNVINIIESFKSLKFPGPIPRDTRQELLLFDPTLSDRTPLDQPGRVLQSYL